MNRIINNKFLWTMLSGILFTISWPTYGFPIFIFFAFVPLLLMEQELSINKVRFSGTKVFFYSFVAFLIWNAVVYHWLFLSEERKYAAYFLPLFPNSILMAAVFWLYHKVKKKVGTLYGLFFFPCIWVSFEFLHLNWELNWPWLNLGNVFAKFHQVVQWYEFTGSFGGSLWILLVNILVFWFWKAWLVSRKSLYLKKLALFTILAISIPSIISIIMYWTYSEKGIDKIEVVLIQPEVDPYNEKYERDSLDLASEIVNIADKGIDAKTDFVVAPETAVPGKGNFNLNSLDNSYLLNGIKNHYANTKITFISGVELEQIYPSEKEKKSSSFYHPYRFAWMDIYNSTLQLNAKDSVQIYIKSKLVPGVEGGFPFYHALKAVFGKEVLDFGGNTISLGVSEKVKVFKNSFNKGIIAPTICYESVFGEKTAEFVQQGANAIFISTNDSWWQNSQGHKQLLVYAKLRAIENRRDVARSANSGVSSFINQKGDITSYLKYQTQGFLKGTMTLNNEKTIYTKYGDYIARIALLFMSFVLAYYISMLILKKK